MLLATISHKNYRDSLYFHEKVLKKCYTCSKIPRIPLPLIQCCAKSGNDQAILQPTLNKGAGGASLTIFVTDCRNVFQINHEYFK